MLVPRVGSGLFFAYSFAPAGYCPLVAGVTMRTAADIAGGHERQPHESLSNREHEVFLHLGCGRSVDEIARELGIKPKTVRSYRTRILEKTKLKSTAEIIFYAVTCGLVTQPAKASDPERPRRPAANAPPTKKIMRTS